MTSLNHQTSPKTGFLLSKQRISSLSWAVSSLELKIHLINGRNQIANQESNVGVKFKGGKRSSKWGARAYQNAVWDIVWENDQDWECVWEFPPCVSGQWNRGWTDSIKYWCRTNISKNHPLLYFSGQQTAQILVPSLWDSYAFLDWSLIFGLSTLQLILDMVARL